jgi:hypothetical protein
MVFVSHSPVVCAGTPLNRLAAVLSDPDSNKKGKHYQLTMELLEDPSFRLKYQKSKLKVKLWESEFRKTHGRNPSKVSKEK